MPTDRRRRAAKILSLPPAVASGTTSRTVTRGTVQLTVWSCPSAESGESLGAPRRVVLAPPLVKNIGGRSWRFFFVSLAEVEQQAAAYGQPGYYFEAMDPRVEWPMVGAIGPYESLEQALEEARFGAAIGVW